MKVVRQRSSVPPRLAIPSDLLFREQGVENQKPRNGYARWHGPEKGWIGPANNAAAHRSIRRLEQAFQPISSPERRSSHIQTQSDAHLAHKSPKNFRIRVATQIVMHVALPLIPINCLRQYTKVTQGYTLALRRRNFS